MLQAEAAFTRVFQLCALLEGWLMLQAKVAFALHQRDLPLEVLGLLLFVTLASADTRWRLASSISFCLWRLRFLRRRARSCSCSSAETPKTSPSSVRSAPSSGAKHGGGYDCPSGPQVRRVSSSVASWWVDWVRGEGLALSCSK
jgi:hypothetical protein